MQITTANLFFYRMAVRLTGIVNVFPTVPTEVNQIKSLIRKLHPVSSEAALIRFGPDGDGGYLIPDDLAGIEACFSPGVCNVSLFEKDCAERGMRVFMADGSVEGPSTTDHRFSFLKKHVGAITTDLFMTMDDWVNGSLPQTGSDLLLQMDIEGYEYETILSMPTRLMQRFRIIVGEFHRLDQLWSLPYFRMASSAFEKILQTHTCVHIHPNNGSFVLKRKEIEIPGVMEFTFMRNDRVHNAAYCRIFPHHLDRPNTEKEEIKLPQCWYNKD